MDDSFGPIGTPLDDVTFTSLPDYRQEVLRAFFQEADALLDETKDLEQADDGRYIPPESLQDKYNTITEFGDDEFCPVQQRVRKFSFKKEKPTIH